MTTQPDWSEYLTQMTHLLDMELDAPRREELERQFARIAAMAQPRMDYPLGPREVIAGVDTARLFNTSPLPISSVRCTMAN